MTARVHHPIVSQQAALRVPRRRIEQGVRAAFRLARIPERPLAITIVDDRAIRRLHHEYLGANCATDVMSFPLLEGEPAAGAYRPDRAEALFGEVVASAETARREAARRGHPPTHELTLYVIHGTLHLLGYDDHDPGDRLAMRRAETHCLAAAGIRGITGGA